MKELYKKTEFYLDYAKSTKEGKKTIHHGATSNSVEERRKKGRKFRIILIKGKRLKKAISIKNMNTVNEFKSLIKE